MNCNYEEEDENNKLKWTVLLLLLLFIIFLMLWIMLLSKEKSDEKLAETTAATENSSFGVRLIIDPNAENGTFYEDDKTWEQGVVIPGWESLIIPAGKKDVAVDFYNPKENEGMYYLTFELRLCDSSEQGYEVLYASGLVEPGKHIDQITLFRGLEKGTHEAVIHVQPYRMNEEKAFTNNADIRIVLIVK